jgi:hypothetical protein
MHTSFLHTAHQCVVLLKYGCIGSFLFLFSRWWVFTRVGPGTTSTLGHTVLHSITFLSLLFHFNLQLSTSRPPLFSFRGWDEFILSDTGEESEWMDWLTFLMICWHLHLRWLRVQHALVFYMLLPVRMTSWVVYNDVYTGDGFVHLALWSISRLGHPRMTSFSLVSFSELRSSFRSLSFFINY